MRKAARWEHVAAKTKKGTVYVCETCGERSKKEQLKGTCRSFALLQTGLATTTKEQYNMAMLKA